MDLFCEFSFTTDLKCRPTFQIVIAYVTEWKFKRVFYKISVQQTCPQIRPKVPLIPIKKLILKILYIICML